MTTSALRLLLSGALALAATAATTLARPTAHVEDLLPGPLTEEAMEFPFDSPTPLLDQPIVGCGKGDMYRRLAARGIAPGGFMMRGNNPPAVSPPDPTDVINNELRIEVAPPGATVTGSNTMTIVSMVEGLTTFDFKLRSSFNVTEVRVKDPNHVSWPLGYTVVPVGPPANSYNRTITFAQPISLGTQFSVTVTYNGTAANVGFGSFFSGTVNGANMVNSLSEPYYAATWWPAKDGDVFKPGDNSDKATLDIYITSPNTYKSTANGVLVGTDVPVAGKIRYHYATTYPIATYLVCFATSTYQTWPASYVYPIVLGQPVPTGTMPLDFNVVPNDNTPAHQSAWNNVVNIMDAYRPWYGLYPFINEKYGIYQMGFGGGMEHQTNTGQGVSGDAPFSTILTAHELGHQWWGDNVTCKFWNDIWLNEGFATYSEALWLESQGGTPAGKALALKNAMVGRKPASPTNSVWVDDAGTANLNRIFSTDSSYNKGSWVLHMLRRIAGDVGFANILSTYRAAYQGGTATSADFAAVASSIVGQDLSWYFTPWLYGAGAPTYATSWQTATIEGQLWLRLRIQQNQISSYATFDMPLTFRVTTTAGTQDFTVRSFSRYVNNDPLQGTMANYHLLPIPAALSGGTPVVLDPDGWVLSYSNTTPAYVAGPPKIVTLTPAPASSATQAATTNPIRIAFSDVVTANSSHFAVTVTNGMGTNPVPFSYSYDGGTNAALLTMTPPLPVGTYNVAVSDNITANSQKLDGEMSSNSPAALPTGEGAAGGQTLYTFTVTANPLCAADFNQNGTVSVQDLFSFLAAYFAQNLSADFNQNGSVTVQDLFSYLAAYFTTCP